MRTTNVGNAAPTGELRLQVQLPSGVTIDPSVEVPPSNWTCTGDRTIECSSADQPLAGTDASPLTIPITATADASEGTATVPVTLRSTDSTGERIALATIALPVQPAPAGELDVARAGLGGTTGPDRSVAYQIEITNSGRSLLRGAATVTEVFPTGTVATGAGEGWTCDAVATTLQCRTAERTLAVGEALPPVSITATFPAGLGGGYAQLGAVAAMGGARGSAAGALAVPAPVPVAARLETAVTGAPAQLVRGATGQATVTVANRGNAAHHDVIAVAVALPRGLTPTSAGGDGWRCAIETEVHLPAAACVRTDGLGAGTSAPAVTVTFDVAETAANPAAIAAGLLANPSGAEPDELVRRVAAGGASVLVDPGVDVRPVRGLYTDAGPDQSVAERTANATGATATIVRLDGRASSAGDEALTWTWVQVGGPAVTWRGTTREVAAADGTTRQAATGAVPSFAVPRLADSTPTAFTFELTAAAGGATGTDQVTVTVTPSPDTAPTLGELTTDIADLAEAPPAGTPVQVGVDFEDPDGDAVAVRWAVASTDGDLATTTITSDDQAIEGPADGSGDDASGDGGSAARSRGVAQASFSWPTNASYVVVEVTATSSRGASTTSSLRIAKPIAPPVVSVSAPTVVGSGHRVVATATIESGEAANTRWRWQQDSGPPIDPAHFIGANGPTFTFEAPFVATEGQTITVSAVLTEVSGLSSRAVPASATIALEPLPAPDLAITGPTATPRGTPVTLTVTGMPPRSTARWTQTAGPEGTFAIDHGDSARFIGDFDGTAAITVDVTDPAGRITSATVEVVVGTVFAPKGDESCSKVGSLINKAFDYATSGGTLSVTVGPVSLTLDELAIDGPCRGAAPALTFAGSTFSVAGGAVTGSDLSGRIDANGVCITGGTVRFPTSWGLRSAELGTSDPICVPLSDGDGASTTGSFTVVGLPFIDLPGDHAPVTEVTFDGPTLTLATEVAIPGGHTLRVDASIDQATGAVEGNVEGQVSVLGTTITVRGTVALDEDGATDFSIEGTAPGPIDLGAGVALSDLLARLDRDGLSLEATVEVANAVSLQASGSYLDVDNWSLAVDGATGASSWSPVPGLSIPASEFGGTVSRTDGDIEFDVSVAVPDEWRPTSGFAVSSILARLSNTAVPDTCPAVEAGSVWLSLEGLVEADFDATTVEVEGQVCIVPGQRAWAASSVATLDSWTPSRSLDVSIESLGLQVRSDGSGSVEVLAFGSARAYGIDLGAVISVQGRSVVVDAVGDLSGLGAGVDLPGGSTGHLLFATAPRDDYAFYHSDAMAAIDGSMEAMDVPAGVSLYAAFSVPGAVRALLTDHLGLPPVTSMVVWATLGSGPPTLRSTITLGGPEGYTLYQHCGGACSTDTRTRVALRAISLTLSANGSVGLASDASLELPKSGPTPASALDLTASITLDMLGPSLAIALYTTDGRWEGALGVNDLVLSELAVQAGIDFGQPIPTPSLGFGATIEHLPRSWASTIGMDPDHQEPMRFGINISTRTPILDLQIGIPDGNTALDLLRPVGAPGIVEVDYASLVIAPFGGTIGQREYEPGMSLAFAASIAGVPLDAAFSVDPGSGSVAGSVEVGTISLGGFQDSDVAASFNLAPTNTAAPFAFALSGAFVLPSLGSGPVVVAGSLDIAVANRGLRGAVDINAANVPLAGLATLEVLSLSASFDVGAGRLPDFALDIAARASIFGATAGAAGSLKVVSGKLTEFSMAVSVAADIGPVSLTGKGCGGVLGTTGACVQFGYAKGKFSAGFDGSIKVSGFSVEVSGSVSSAYIRGSAKINMAGIGDFALSGSLYYGSDDALRGITDIDLNGVKRQVRQGDFAFSMGGKAGSGKVGGFSASLSAVVSRVGGTSGVRISGMITVPGGQVRGGGMVSLNGSTVYYDVSASGSLSLEYFALASAEVRLKRDAAGVVATLGAKVGFWSMSGIANAEVRGTITSGKTLGYDLTGTATARTTMGLNLNLALRFTKGTLSFSTDLSAASVFNVTLKGTVNAAGWVNLSGSVSFQGFTGTFSVGLTLVGWSLSVGASYQGLHLGSFPVTANQQIMSIYAVYSKSGEINAGIFKIGGSFSGIFSTTITIRSVAGLPVLDADASGRATAKGYFKHYGCSGAKCVIGKGWGWKKTNLGTVSATIRSSGRMCASIKGGV